MSNVILSVGDIVNESWSLIKKNIWIFAGTMLGFSLIIGIIFAMFGGIGAISMNAGGDVASQLAGLFGMSFIFTVLLIIILSIVFSVGYQRMALIAADGLEPTFSAFSISLKKILNAVFASILVGILVEIGIILCVIPGIILAVRLQFFIFYILDKDCSAIDAMSKSWEDTKGQTLNLVLLFLAFYLINILGTICCFIGLFVTAPMQSIGMALVYRKLTGEIPADGDFDKLSEPEPANIW